MRRFLPGLLLIFAAEGVALACSCVQAPTDPQEARTLGRRIARDAIALVEVELLVPYDGLRNRGEQMRVRRTLAGRAPARFQVERRGPPSSAACDLEFQPGRRALILLFPPQLRPAPTMASYRVSTSCTAYLLADPTIRATVAAELDRRR